MRRLVFAREAVCGWTEPPFARFEGPPRCVADPAAPPAARGETGRGRLHRAPTCELRYGPFNCNFLWRADNWCARRARRASGRARRSVCSAAPAPRAQDGLPSSFITIFMLRPAQGLNELPQLPACTPGL
jgi:hypothetical protein